MCDLHPSSRIILRDRCVTLRLHGVRKRGLPSIHPRKRLMRTSSASRKSELQIDAFAPFVTSLNGQPLSLIISCLRLVASELFHDSCCSCALLWTRAAWGSTHQSLVCLLAVCCGSGVVITCFCGGKEGSVIGNKAASAPGGQQPPPELDQELCQVQAQSSVVRWPRELAAYYCSHGHLASWKSSAFATMDGSIRRASLATWLRRLMSKDEERLRALFGSLKQCMLV